MKSFSILLALLAVTFLSSLEAAPVTARYLRFEGYYSSNTDSSWQIAIYEIEAWSNGLNAARTSTVTANSGWPSNNSTNRNYLNDGNTAGSLFYSSKTNPGPASEAAPHWVQMDLGSAKPIDRIKIYLSPFFLIDCGIFLSSDGIKWTQYARYDQVSDLIERDFSAPYVVIQSATMRPGTALMDVVYRVNDPDDITVKTRALAFVDGVRSFANVVKPVTFAEGTAAKLGDAIATNTNHTLTWDVAADWNVQLGQIKFEVLAMDGRGLLPFEWITIPAAGGDPALTVSKNSPTDTEVLNAYFWQFANGDSGLSLLNGSLTGNGSSGVFNNVVLANGSALEAYSAPFIFKRMNLDIDDGLLASAARAGLSNPRDWHAARRPYAGAQILVGWGDNRYGDTTIPSGLSGVTAIAAAYYNSLALKTDGTVVSWGSTNDPLSGLSSVKAIAAGIHHSLALKSDGTVAARGSNEYGQTTIPAGLSDVTAIAAGYLHSLALKSDGTVVAWGANDYGQTTIPAGLSGVTAIVSGGSHNLALKSDGTVVAWGANWHGQTTIPAGLSGVTAIAAGHEHSLALKNDGTVVGWGASWTGQTTIPAGLSGVTAIAAGTSHSLALKSDGTVVGWGGNNSGQTTIPSGLSGVTAIAAGGDTSFAIKAKAP